MDKQVMIEVQKDGTVIRTELTPFFGNLMRMRQTQLAGPSDKRPPIPANDRTPLTSG